MIAWCHAVLSRDVLTSFCDVTLRHDVIPRRHATLQNHTIGQCFISWHSNQKIMEITFLTWWPWPLTYDLDHRTCDVTTFCVLTTHKINCDDIIPFCVYKNCSSIAPQKIHPKPPNILLMSNHSAMRALTHGHTHRQDRFYNLYHWRGR